MNKKVHTGIILVFLAALAVSATIFAAKAAPTILLTPTSGEPSVSVHVEGSDFAASKAVGIGFGAEVAVTGEVVNETGSGTGPYVGTFANRPVKPGTAKYTVDIGAGVVTYDVTDLGNGTFTSTSGYFAGGTINYATGQYIAYATSDPHGYTVVVTADYNSYLYDVTPPTEIITNSSGIFSDSFNVPNHWNGTHTVTVIDEEGNMATADFTVVGSDFIPEPLTVGAVVLLTSTAIFVSFYWMRKRNYKKA
jgi:hypothetical protein